jgi:hypothetical protein
MGGKPPPPSFCHLSEFFLGSCHRSITGHRALGSVARRTTIRRPTQRHSNPRSNGKVAEQSCEERYGATPATVLPAHYTRRSLGGRLLRHFLPLSSLTFRLCVPRGCCGRAGEAIRKNPGLDESRYADALADVMLSPKRIVNIDLRQSMIDRLKEMDRGTWPSARLPGLVRVGKTWRREALEVADISQR